MRVREENVEWETEHCKTIIQNLALKFWLKESIGNISTQSNQ